MIMAVKPPLVSNGTRECTQSAIDAQFPLTLPHRRLPPVAAVESDVPHPHHQGSATFRDSRSFQDWGSLTAKFSAAANIPILLRQLPQIILNVRNLLSGNKTVLLAIPWLGMLIGLLGNLSLLSYFTKKREKEAMVIQTVAIVSVYVVLAQLAIAEAMPLPHFLATSAVVSSGLVINLMNYFNVLPVQILNLWEDFITVGGLSVLPQVMWSTFVPFVPSSILPGSVALVTALVAVALARAGKLPDKGVKFVGALSGWTATLLLMWMPVSQLWTNYLNPENIKGLSALTMLLAMLGNGLMIPRSLFIRDLMWFKGAVWATICHGYANIVCLYCCNNVSREFFIATTAGLVSWIGFIFWRDSVVFGFCTPLSSLKELRFGS